MVERTPARLKTPRAAAWAGIVFAVVILVAFAILLHSLQPRAGDSGPGRARRLTRWASRSS